MVAASGEVMLLDIIATIILAGMMLVPLVNIFVGTIVGAGLAGLSGGMLGLALAVVVTAAVKLVGVRRGWFEVACESDTAIARVQPSTIARSTKRRMLPRRLLASRAQPTMPTMQMPERQTHTLH
jgi:hypothetical protein